MERINRVFDASPNRPTRCPPSLLADGKNIQSLETNLSQEIVGGTSSAAAMDGQVPKMTRMSNSAATTVIRAQRRLSIDSPGRGVVLRENGGGQKRLAARILAYTSLTEPSFNGIDVAGMDRKLPRPHFYVPQEGFLFPSLSCPISNWERGRSPTKINLISDIVRTLTRSPISEGNCTRVERGVTLSGGSASGGAGRADQRRRFLRFYPFSGVDISTEEAIFEK